MAESRKLAKSSGKAVIARKSLTTEMPTGSTTRPVTRYCEVSIISTDMNGIAMARCLTIVAHAATAAGSVML